MKKPIRIGIADDHTLVLEGFKNTLQLLPGLKVCITATSGEMLLNEMSRQKIDVVLLDVKMPDMDGMQVARLIQNDYRDVKIVAVSVCDHWSTIQDMQQAGAMGYVLKSAHPKELHMAIIQAMENRSFLCSEASRSMAKRNAYASQMPVLTEKENQLSDLILQQKSDHAIAAIMRLTQKTVSNLKNQLFVKLGVDTVVGFVLNRVKGY